MLARALKALRDGILSTTYPEQCRICGESVESYDFGVVCQSCWNNPKITRLLNGYDLCHRCGDPLAFRAASAGCSDSGKGHFVPAQTARSCGHCETAAFQIARASGIYDGTLEASIIFLKSQPHICAKLRDLITSTIRQNSELLGADLVIAVPLHRSRARERGFNQSALISRIVAASFDRDVDYRSLVRAKQTERHRAGMDIIDRRKSVVGAFEVVAPRLVEGRSILLVDDVYTTGSTVDSAAKTLLAAGADKVKVFTIARVPWSR